MSLPDTGFNILTPTRYGAMLVNRHDQYVGESLIKLGEYSKAELAFLRAIIPVGGTVVEAGAHIGALTIPLAQHMGREGSVYAFEPQVSCYHLLCANLALASLTNTTAINMAAGDESVVLDVPRYNPASPHNSGGSRLRRIREATVPETQPLRCFGLKLDTWHPTRLGWQPGELVRLIKADVEGMEIDVLKGAEALIHDHRPLLYLEAYDEDKRWALFAWLVAHQYQFRWHLPPMYAPDNWKNAPNPWHEGLISLNVIAVPDERATDFWAQHGSDPYLKEVKL